MKLFNLVFYILVIYFTNLRFVYAKFHYIKMNETLWSIARKYNVTIRSIMQANTGLKADFLISGSKIFVPVITFKNFKTYKIKKGDTFYSIAKLFNLNISQLLNINQLNLTNLLFVNQVIKIPFFKNSINSVILLSDKDSIIKNSILEDKLYKCGINIKTNDFKLRSFVRGKVIFIGFLRGYGKIIIIKHQLDDLISVYSAKNLKIKVKFGDQINKNQIIAIKTNNNNKFSNFNYQLWKNGNPLNVKDYSNFVK